MTNGTEPSPTDLRIYRHVTGGIADGGGRAGYKQTVPEEVGKLMGKKIEVNPYLSP